MQVAPHITSTQIVWEGPSTPPDASSSSSSSYTPSSSSSTPRSPPSLEPAPEPPLPFSTEESNLPRQRSHHLPHLVHTPSNPLQLTRHSASYVVPYLSPSYQEDEEELHQFSPDNSVPTTTEEIFSPHTTISSISAFPPQLSLFSRTSTSFKIPPKEVLKQDRKELQHQLEQQVSASFASHLYKSIFTNYYETTVTIFKILLQAQIMAWIAVALLLPWAVFQAIHGGPYMPTDTYPSYNPTSRIQGPSVLH